MFVVDLLPIELVLGFNRGLKVIEDDMDELFSHRKRTAQCQCLYVVTMEPCNKLLLTLIWWFRHFTNLPGFHLPKPNLAGSRTIQSQQKFIAGSHGSFRPLSYNLILVRSSASSW